MEFWNSEDEKQTEKRIRRLTNVTCPRLSKLKEAKREKERGGRSERHFEKTCTLFRNIILVSKVKKSLLTLGFEPRTFIFNLMNCLV